MNDIVEIPSGIVLTNYYGYDHGYYQADSILPGKAYWVKTNGGGHLALNSQPATLDAKTVAKGVQEYKTDQLNWLAFESGNESRSIANRRKFQLMIGSNLSKELSLERSELPPIPPGGSFDVRFVSNRSLELHDEYLATPVEFPLSIQSPNAQCKLSWSMRDQKQLKYTLVEKKDHRIISQHRLVRDGSTVIDVNKGTSYAVRVEQIPTTFLLKQNYPNPFNPTTTIEFGLPHPSVVTIKVYNALGEELVTLLDRKTLDEGFQMVDFDANGLASGVYFYRIVAQQINDGGVKAETFQSVRKMMLIR